MANPVVVESDIDLSSVPGNKAVSFKLVVDDGAARLAFGAELFKGSKFIETVVKFPDDDDVNTLFKIDKATVLRGLNIDVFGRIFPGTPDTMKLHCEFFVGDTLVGQSGQATLKTTATQVIAEFHINCLFK